MSFSSNRAEGSATGVNGGGGIVPGGKREELKVKFITYLTIPF